MGSILGQALLDSILAIPEETPLGKLMVRGLNLVRTSVARHWDPLVTYKYDGFKLELPLSHNLPISRKRHPHYSSNIGRIAAAIASELPNAAVIDIGANIGDSVATIRKSASLPILCVEADPRFVAILKRNIINLGTDVEIYAGFVAAQTSYLSGTFRTHNGTGRLETDALGSQISGVSLQDILARYPRFQYPQLLKIDTDGYDFPILRGILPLLRDIKPALFFEYDPSYLKDDKEEGLNVIETLHDLGYTYSLIYDNLGDLIMSCTSFNRPQWVDLQEYFSGRRSQTYMDICLLDGKDSSLFELIRKNEHKFMSDYRHY